MPRTPSHPMIVCLLAVGCWSAGCGGSGSPTVVTGKVLMDGQPLGGAQIQLLSKGDASGEMHSGTTDAKGAFTISEPSSSNNPIRSGTYVVLVSKFSVKADAANQPGGAMGGMVNEIQGIYQDRSASPLVVEIQSGKTELRPLELKSAPEKPAASAGK